MLQRCPSADFLDNVSAPAARRIEHLMSTYSFTDSGVDQLKGCVEKCIISEDGHVCTAAMVWCAVVVVRQNSIRKSMSAKKNAPRQLEATLANQSPGPGKARETCNCYGVRRNTPITPRL